MLGDCFQVAIEKVPKVLRACNPNHTVSLKTYSRVAFENIIRDMLRRQHQLSHCNDWALLLKVSRKQLQEALQHMGLLPAAIDSYLCAQQCYEEGYWLLKSAARQTLDQVAQGMAGVMSLTGEVEGQPMRVGLPIGDLTAGMWARWARWLRSATSCRRPAALRRNGGHV
ncbi:MAG: hypothetical protein HC881_08245 [Leptolyngbyaceae cyanobacterium SL_7_1]|nr:hypothetical protein [Leptolyngbyaceae cyanobacterium SL_7_1]